MSYFDGEVKKRKNNVSDEFTLYTCTCVLFTTTEKNNAATQSTISQKLSFCAIKVFVFFFPSKIWAFINCTVYIAQQTANYHWQFYSNEATF